MEWGGEVLDLAYEHPGILLAEKIGFTLVSRTQSDSFILQMTVCVLGFILPQ